MRVIEKKKHRNRDSLFLCFFSSQRERSHTSYCVFNGDWGYSPTSKNARCVPPCPACHVTLIMLQIMLSLTTGSPKESPKESYTRFGMDRDVHEKILYHINRRMLYFSGMQPVQPFISRTP